MDGQNSATVYKSIKASTFREPESPSPLSITQLPSAQQRSSPNRTLAFCFHFVISLSDTGKTAYPAFPNSQACEFPIIMAELADCIVTIVTIGFSSSLSVLRQLALHLSVWHREA